MEQFMDNDLLIAMKVLDPSQVTLMLFMMHHAGRQINWTISLGVMGLTRYLTYLCVRSNLRLHHLSHSRKFQWNINAPVFVPASGVLCVNKSCVESGELIECVRGQCGGLPGEKYFIRGVGGVMNRYMSQYFEHQQWCGELDRLDPRVFVSNHDMDLRRVDANNVNGVQINSVFCGPPLGQPGYTMDAKSVCDFDCNYRYVGQNNSTLYTIQELQERSMGLDPLVDEQSSKLVNNKSHAIESQLFF